MKNIEYLLVLILTLPQFVLSFDDDAEAHAEVFIVNRSTSKDVYVKVIPVGFIFNGKYNGGSNYSIHEYKYSVEAARQLTVHPNFVFGGSKSLLKFNTVNGLQWENRFYLSTDNSTHDGCDSLIGIGKFRIEFWNAREDDGMPDTYIDYCTIDFNDFDYPGVNGYTNNDVTINFYSDNDIRFSFPGGGTEFSIADGCVNRDLKIWQQLTGNSPCSYGVNKAPNKGNFKTTTSTNGLSYLNLPIKSTSYTGFSAHLDYGSLFVNLSVDNSHYAYIKSNEIMYIESGGIFNLLSGSTLEFLSNSTLYVKKGGKFCNYGGTIINSHIIYETRGVYTYCNYYNGPIKGGSLILEDSAIVEFPDSTTLTFDSTSKLIMKPHSEIRMGRYSKIIFEDGSSISCDNAKFTTLDSTQTWDGIYLEGIAYDTLKNCTFQNAVNGINITDNYNPFGSPGAVEINNCTFKNSTSSELLNYVYVNNSYNVLVKGCNAVKTGSGGFTSGIIAEYCPTNGVVIADNNINYVTTGISLLQSSEYIGRNTITGSTNSGSGMYLDNSNGTIEYNTVNNFQKSVYGSYSSPYILKNTLYDASLTNIDLVDGSMPVMKPVISSSTLRWLGGNNTISGFPSNSGIRFADCYPLMDSGYNKIVVNGSDYMNGNFTFSITTVPARLNYWFDSPPISSLFNISSGNVNSSNPFNGSSLPSTDGTELNSLGWGMYDTVFTKSLGDNSTAEDLFMQAYTEEMSQNYTDAVTHYKEVVSSYKSSSYAPVSLSRIFNCLEKSHATSSDYQSIQTYYNSIKSNSVYPNESRELSEDFVIKSKVKQGSIEEAVSDYNAIYQANQNNSKGLHALLNKYCLENMVQGDNSSGNTNYENHKINILSLITGENIRTNNLSNNNTPKQFRLLQNYPNPFNPVTNIKYEVPKDVNVSIKIYDLLGKEVFSFNEYKKAGSYEVMFDGTNLASGMYFYKLVAVTSQRDVFTDTKKMVLLK